MDSTESIITASLNLSSTMSPTYVTDGPPDAIDTPVTSIQSPIVVLIWFEIIAACLVYGLGFVGNILSLIIFSSSSEFRRVSTGFFFLLTSIFNSFHLWSLTTEFLGVYNIYIYSDDFLQCRLNYFVQNVSRAMSTYLAIGIALDRFIRSELPLRSRRICTRRNAVIYSAVCFVLFSLVWSVWFSPEITRDPGSGTCIFNKSGTVYFLLSQVQPPARFIVVCILPVAIMIAANIRMLYNMRQSHRRVANQIEVPTALVVSVATQSLNRAARRMTPIDRMLFYMMLANVGTFIVTQIPFHVYTLIRTYSPTLDPFTHSLVRAILLIWSSIYFGVAFYLYCLAAPLFRGKFFIIGKKIIRLLKN